MKKEDLYNKTGCVLRIERSSLHDGEGLRTVVFLKGCPLRCLWCSTPESQLFKKELGFRAIRCTGCGSCAAACESGAIRMINDMPVRDTELCRLCFACEKACPGGAWQIYGTDMTSEELAQEIAKDEIFYFHSEGGVTFSGGEPLEQADFVAAVMRRCREHGIHTAMETSLYARWERIEKVLPYLDLLFTDLKMMGCEAHRRAAGVDNQLILDNLIAVNASDFSGSIHVRVPVIPGINDDEDNLRATVRFCEPLEKIKEIELLPYHRLGVETYRNLRREYQLSETESPTAERMQHLKEFMKMEAVRVGISISS